MKQGSFLSVKFPALILLVFSLFLALGAGVGGYDETYALWIGWLINLSVALWHIIESYHARKP